MNKRYKLTIANILVVLAITGPWFLKRGYLFLTDFVWGPRLQLRFFESDWLPNLFLKPIQMVLPMDLIQKLFVALTLFVLLMAGEKIAKNFSRQFLIRLAAGLFLIFNPFVYDRLMFGQISVALALGFLAWHAGILLSYFLHTDDKPLPPSLSTPQIVGAGVTAGASLLFSPHFTFLAAALDCAFLAALLSHRGWIRIRKVTLNIFWVALLALALNANWLWGLASHKTPTATFINKGITINDLGAFATSGASGIDALKNVALLSGFWGKDQFRYEDLSRFAGVWGRSFLVLLPFIIWGIWVGIQRKRSRPLFLALLAVLILAALLAVGTRMSATRAMTEWLFYNIPFYKGLRETQKWAGLLVIIYAIFLSQGLAAAFEKTWIKHNAFLVFSLMCAVIILQAPLLLWGFHGQARPADYPADWTSADIYLRTVSNCQGNLLFLPWHLYMRLEFAGAVAANPAKKFFSCPVISGTNMEYGGIYDNSQSPQGMLVGQWLQSRGNNNFLSDNPFDMGYVILAKEADWQNYEWLSHDNKLEQVTESKTLRIYKVKSLR